MVGNWPSDPPYDPLAHPGWMKEDAELLWDFRIRLDWNPQGRPYVWAPLQLQHKQQFAWAHEELMRRVFEQIPIAKKVFRILAEDRLKNGEFDGA